MCFAIRRRTLAIAVAAFCRVVPFPARASAGPVDCTGPDLFIDATPQGRWADAFEAVRLRLQQKLDLDRCARIRLERAGDTMTVRVSLPDGRRAARRVGEPAELLEVVEALLLLPTSVISAEAQVFPPDIGADVPARSVSTRATSMTPLRLELGFGAEGRVSGAPTYGGVGVVTSAELAREAWLVGIAARWEIAEDTITRPSPDGFNMQGFGLAVAIGRRIAAGAVDVDGLVRPEVVVEVQEADGSGREGIGGTESDVRLDALVRVSGPRVSRTRLFAAADVDISPSRVRNSKRMDPRLPALPSWSSGLAVGIIWGGF